MKAPTEAVCTRIIAAALLGAGVSRCFPVETPETETSNIRAPPGVGGNLDFKLHGPFTWKVSCV